MMKVGITGSRYGMCDDQKRRVFKLLLDKFVEGNELHHGDCLGVDFEVAEYAKTLGYKIVCHPPIKNYMRAYHNSHEIRKRCGYISRDKNIVDEVDLLIAVPNTMSPQKGSGTWFTYKYALTSNKTVVLILPNAGGTVID